VLQFFYKLSVHVLKKEDKKSTLPVAAHRSLDLAQEIQI
jgi:hypothetical protein